MPFILTWVVPRNTPPQALPRGNTTSVASTECCLGYNGGWLNGVNRSPIVLVASMRRVWFITPRRVRCDAPPNPVARTLAIVSGLLRLQAIDWDRQQGHWGTRDNRRPDTKKSSSNSQRRYVQYLVQKYFAIGRWKAERRNFSLLLAVSVFFYQRVFSRLKGLKRLLRVAVVTEKRTTFE